MVLAIFQIFHNTFLHTLLLHVLSFFYDYYNVLLYDKEKQETYYGGMNDSTALFENSGNEFITYIKKFEK